MPDLFIIGGCNGAGKTTAYYNFIAKRFNCPNFVNADEIGKELSELNEKSGPIAAGKEFYKRIAKLIADGESFAFESTLASKTLSSVITRCKQSGYKIHLVYFWLNNYELAIERVINRVKEGGHNIPKEDIQRRYFRGIRNLIEIYIPISDYYMVVDNSLPESEIICEGINGQEFFTFNKEKWEVINRLNYER